MLITQIVVMAALVLAWLAARGRVSQKVLGLLVAVAGVSIPGWWGIKDYTAAIVCEHPEANFSNVQITLFKQSRYADDPACAISKKRFLSK